MLALMTSVVIPPDAHTAFAVRPPAPMVSLRHALGVLIRALALAGGLVVFMPVAQAETRRHELIYGAELMTPVEREAYRRAHESLSDESARRRYERQHRERLQLRARRQGVELREPDGVLARGDRSGARPGARP